MQKIREIEQETQRKNPFPQGYPKDGIANTPDSTSRFMRGMEITEAELEKIKELKQGRTFDQFAKHVCNHKMLAEKPGEKRKACLENIRVCLEIHPKDENGNLKLDRNKVDTSIHPLYDLYRVYKNY